MWFESSFGDTKHKDEELFQTPYFPFTNAYDTDTSGLVDDLSNTLFKDEPIDIPFSTYIDSSVLDTVPFIAETGNNKDLPSLMISVQPPVEVRTRTMNEKRSFSCAVDVCNHQPVGATQVGVDLAYAASDARPSQDILGGHKLVKIAGDRAHFELSMSEASTKHKGNEFVLEFFLVTPDGKRIEMASGTSLWRSQPFYAYSNQKVLSRRRNIVLRAISKNRVQSKGNETMHVIGSPFIDSPSLCVLISTAHGEIPIRGSNIELYSESVLFFQLPPYPMVQTFPDGFELRAQVRVSNDGRYYSNPVDFTYVVENEFNGNKRLRSRF